MKSKPRTPSLLEATFASKGKDKPAGLMKRLTKARLTSVNNRIAAGGVVRVSGDEVEAPLEEALITENDSTIYPIQSGIPVMLEDEGIMTAQFGNHFGNP